MLDENELLNGLKEILDFYLQSLPNSDVAVLEKRLMDKNEAKDVLNFTNSLTTAIALSYALKIARPELLKEIDAAVDDYKKLNKVWFNYANFLFDSSVEQMEENAVENKEQFLACIEMIKEMMFK